MNKQMFLDNLAKKISVLPAQEIQKSINFYDEIIEDRLEEGEDENQIIANLGSIDSIVDEIFAEYSLTQIIEDKISNKTSKLSKRTKILTIILLIICSPIIIPIVLSLVLIIFSIYLAIFALIITGGSIIVSFAIYATVGCIDGIRQLISVSTADGLFILGTAFLSAAGFIISSLVFKIIVGAMFKLHAKLFKNVKSRLLNRKQVI